jgi:chromosome partitioning protein
MAVQPSRKRTEELLVGRDHAIVVGVANRKGGAGKTSTVISLAGELTTRGARVLVVDLDPQASLTAIAKVDPDELAPEHTSLALLTPEAFDNRIQPRALPRPAPWGGDFIPCANKAEEAEKYLPGATGAIKRLDRALRELRPGYDVILLDTRPAPSMSVQNAMFAADFMLIPVPADVQGAFGLRSMIRDLEEFIEYDHPELRVLGAFITATEKTRHAAGTSEILRETFGDLILDTEIPKRTDLKNAQAVGESLATYDPTNAAAVAYSQLLDEIAARMLDSSDDAELEAA